MKRDLKTKDMIQQISGHVSVEELHEAFTYQDGNLIVRKNGKIAGYVDPGKKGYVRIQMNGKKYYRHRLIWMMHFGYITDDLFVDHKNGVYGDDRIENLRLLDPQQNSQNKRNAYKNSLVNFIGVSMHGKRFRARIHHEGKSISIGNFLSAQEAHAAYLQYKKILHKGFHHEESVVIIKKEFTDLPENRDFFEDLEPEQSHKGKHHE